MTEIKTKDVIDIEEGGNDQERGIGSFKNIIPPNVRMFMADLFGSKEKFTEKDLTPEYQNLLKSNLFNCYNLLLFSNINIFVLFSKS